MRNRLIPIITLDCGDVVKTRKFKNPNYIGDPINTIKLFNELFADELIVLDIGVSKSETDIDYQLIEQITSNAFMPLAYGGGIKSLEQCNKLFKLGVEKVVVSSAAIQDFSLLDQIADRYGKQALIVDVTVKSGMFDSEHKLFNSRSRKFAKSQLHDYVNTIAEKAGEIMITNVDRDGTMIGIDTRLVERFSHLECPVIHAGGAITYMDLKCVVESGGDALAAGSMFVYYGETKGVLINYPNETQLNALISELYNGTAGENGKL